MLVQQRILVRLASLKTIFANFKLRSAVIQRRPETLFASDVRRQVYAGGPVPTIIMIYTCKCTAYIQVLVCFLYM